MNQEELNKLKFWIDTEFTVLHILFGVVIWLLTHNVVAHIFIALYIVISLVYYITRIAYISSVDKNYLKLPRT